jgi:hypothetical protein
MKEILIRLLVAAFITFAAFALSSSARGQQPEAGPNPVDQNRRQQKTTAESRPLSETTVPVTTHILSRDDDQTQDALVFTGQIAKEKGSLILIDPIARISYRLNDQARVKSFAGHQVRVVGKLEMRSNTILVEKISTTR